MAVITPGSVAGLFGATAQRAPYQGRKAIDSGEETEAQKLARESNERIAAQTSKDRTAALITNSVLQFSNMALQGALQGWKIGQDPAAIRSQVAQAEMLQDKAAEIEGSIGMEPLTDLPAPATGAPTTGPAPTGAPPAAAREPIAMPQGALEMLLENMPGVSAEFAAGSPGRKNLRAQLVKLPGVEDDAQAEGLISSFLSQGEFLQKNHQAMIDSGALKMEEGEGYPFWHAIASSMKKGSRWAQQYGVSQALVGAAGPAGGGVAGRPTEDYMGKLAAVREKVGDDDLLAKVIEKVVASPAGPALLEEAAALSPGIDWEAIAEAVKKGDRGPAIDALMGALNMTPEQLRTATPVEGLDRAMSFFGPDGEPRIALDDSVRDLKKAAHALEAAGKDDLAAKLRTKEAWGRTHDWESVVPGKFANRPDAGMGAYFDEGEAKRGMDPRARAKAMYDLATGEAELKTKELTAQAKMARARRLTTNKEFIRDRTRINSNTDPAQRLEEWREHDMFHDLVNGTEHVKGYPKSQVEKWAKDMAYGRKGSGKFRQHHKDLVAAHDKKVAELGAATKAEDKAAERATKDKQQLLTQKRQFEKDVRDRKADLKKVLSRWGVSPGGKVSATKWVDRKLAETPGLSTGQTKKRRTALLGEASAGLQAANTEIAAAVQAVTDAEAAKTAFLKTFEK